MYVMLPHLNFLLISLKFQKLITVYSALLRENIKFGNVDSSSITILKSSPLALSDHYWSLEQTNL